MKDSDEAPVKPEPVSIEGLATIRMVAGGENRISRVILRGRIREWVGIGWIDCGKATPEDYLTIPEVL
jgi:hypothetical protein